MKKTIFLLLFVTTTVFAQIPQLLKDINVGIASSTITNSNSFLKSFPYNNGLFFLANDGISTALWFSNGTTTGTNKIITASTGTSIAAYNFLAFKGRVLFTDNYNVWITNGTNAGTYKISSISNMTVNTPFTIVGNDVYFSGSTAANGREIFKTDTVVGSTSILKDVWAGPSSSLPVLLSFPILDDNAGGFYFVANDGTAGDELWHTNGTTAGTYLVKDIVSGTAGSSIGLKGMANNIVFFMANDGVNGSELWRSDGTTGGTYLLNQITPGPAGSTLGASISYNNKFIYMQSSTVIAETDGTIANSISYTIMPSYYPVSNFYLFNNELYIFGVRDKPSPPAFPNDHDSIALFKISNTILNSIKLKTISNQGCAQSSSFGTLDFLTTNLNKFVAQQISTPSFLSCLLVVSDGTALGTVFIPAGSQSFPHCVFNSSFSSASNSRVPFISNNWLLSVRTATPTDTELYTMDYNSLAVSQVKNINPSGDCWNSTPGWYNFVQINNKVYFLANDGTTGAELWQTDGTNAGTNLLLDIYPGNTGGPDMNGRMVPSGNNLFFIANDGVTGSEPWILNNSGVGLEEKEISNGIIKAFPNPFKNELSVNYILASQNNDATINLIEIASGRLLQQQHVNENKGTLKFNTENLSSGIYLVSIQQKNYPNISLKVVNIK